MSVQMFTGTWTSREPFGSVGMVCRCGRAVAGMEGVTMMCARCGAVYLISVTAIDPTSTTSGSAATEKTNA